MSIRLDGVGAAHPGGDPVLHGIDLHIRSGERLAIIGPSGAGKTSLLRVMGSSLPARSGTLQILSEEPGRLSARALKGLRSRIGMIHQSPPLPARQRVVTAVTAGRLGQWSTLRALASLCYPLDVPGVSAVLRPLDLGDKLFQRCDQLSGGQLQRVGIARALYQRAEVILADEPVSAMDPNLADHTLGLLNRLAAERGTTLIASLHAVDLALRHFPRVIGLRDGSVMFDCAAADVTEADLQALYANASLDSTLERQAASCTVPGFSPASAARSVAPRCL